MSHCSVSPLYLIRREISLVENKQHTWFLQSNGGSLVAFCRYQAGIAVVKREIGNNYIMRVCLR